MAVTRIPIPAAWAKVKKTDDRLALNLPAPNCTSPHEFSSRWLLGILGLGQDFRLRRQRRLPKSRRRRLMTLGEKLVKVGAKVTRR